MFTYLDPEVRQKLVADGKLIKITRDGAVIPNDADISADDIIINLLGPIPLPINLSNQHYQVSWYAAVRSTELQKVEDLANTLRKSGGQNLFADLASSMAVNSVLIIGDPLSHKPDNATDAKPLVRVHSNCLTGDVFGSERCECGPQLSSAVQRISQDPSGGMIIYMAGHEGRGIGLWAKAATYILQDTGEDTYQANESLGLPADSRDFTDAAALIHHFLGNRPIRLLTNNPKKIEDLNKAGLDQLEIEKHVAGVSQWNKNYLTAKQKWGHQIPSEDIEK